MAYLGAGGVIFWSVQDNGSMKRAGTIHSSTLCNVFLEGCQLTNSDCKNQARQLRRDFANTCMPTYKKLQ